MALQPADPETARRPARLKRADAGEVIAEAVPAGFVERVDVFLRRIEIEVGRDRGCDVALDDRSADVPIRPGSTYDKPGRPSSDAHVRNRPIAKHMDAQLP